MGIPIIIVFLSLVFQTEAVIVANGGQSAIIQTGPGFDAQVVGPIGSGDDFGVGGFLPMVGLPLLGLLLLLGLAAGTPTGGTATGFTACPVCPTIATTTCPTTTACVPVPACPTGYERLGSPTGILTKCYQIVTGTFTFVQALAACYAKGGILTEFSNAGEGAAVQALTGAVGGTYYVGYTEGLNVGGPLLGANSNLAPTGVTFPAGGAATIDCGTLTGSTLGSQLCTNTVATGAICEARIDPAAVRCVCP